VSDLARAVSFLRENDRAVADRVEPLPRGEVLLTPSLPLVYDANFMVVETAVGADEAAAEADRVMGDAGLGHRRVNLADGEMAARLAPGLGGLGWEAQPLLVMALRSVPATEAATPVAEVELADLDEMRAEAMHSYPWRTPGLSDQLVELDRRRAGSMSVRAFAVRADGRLVSHALLFRNGSNVAQVESVETLGAYRGRGYAKAVVSAAVEAASDAGLIFLVAEAEDWPKHLYRKLGFEAVGREWQFLKRL
jgi:ribosomal protein S18 acetylase RimI-like enzyme